MLYCTVNLSQVESRGLAVQYRMILAGNSVAFTLAHPRNDCFDALPRCYDLRLPSLRRRLVRAPALRPLSQAHWRDFAHFKEVEAERRGPNRADITTDRLFLSHSWRNAAEQIRKRRIIAAMSRPRAVRPAPSAARIQNPDRPPSQLRPTPPPPTEALYQYRTFCFPAAVETQKSKRVNDRQGIQHFDIFDRN